MSSAQTSGRPNAADRCDTLTLSSFAMSKAPVTRLKRSPPVKKPRGCAPMVLHAREQAIAHLRIARALPLGEPGARERTPVRAEPQVREIALRDRGGPARGIGELAAGLHGAQRARRLELLAHEIADAFVGRQEIIEAAVQRGADAQLLGRAAPVLTLWREPSGAKRPR